MRIAYVLTSLGRGGAERQVIALSERMASRGHHVFLLVLKPVETHKWPTSIKVIRVDMRKSLRGVCSGLARAHRELRSFRPDIVHSHTFPANMAARILHIFGSAPAVLSTIHNIYEGRWWRATLYGLTDRLCMHTTAVSDAVAERQIKIGAVPRHKCSVVTNGIDSDSFKPSTACSAEVRAQLNAADSFVWLAAGRLTPAKDYPNLLRAFTLLRFEFPSAQLWIAGQGTALEEKRLQGLAESTGNSPHLRWLGLRDDMPALLNAADAFVLSSAWEGMPLVVGEAMAAGKPVVATEVGGVAQLVGDAGVLVPSKSSKALAQAMSGVMRMTEEQRQAIGDAARARIRHHFDMNAKADEWEDLYFRLVPACR
ncbi:glycosyltransferase [Telmatobacter sp. DSM 110680]|uniref:Glycosyltransferase n=1 Tax=Telmatobacter sp. DSM 110680 TaxID=3036704 RepID=A0AAU7DEI6_9BACT